jgi:hypothetical protein
MIIGKPLDTQLCSTISTGIQDQVWTRVIININLIICDIWDNVLESVSFSVVNNVEDEYREFEIS